MPQTPPTEGFPADLVYDDYSKSQQQRFLIFLLDDREYGIEIRFVTEICGLPSIGEAPANQPWYTGTIQARGRDIPLLDVRRRLAMEQRGYDDRTSVVIVSTPQGRVGLVVDAVQDLCEIPKKRIRPPHPADVRFAGISLGLGQLGDRSVTILDSGRLTAPPEDADRS